MTYVVMELYMELDPLSHIEMTVMPLTKMVEVLFERPRHHMNVLEEQYQLLMYEHLNPVILDTHMMKLKKNELLQLA